MTEDPTLLYREVQGFLPWEPFWSWLLVGGFALLPLVIILVVLVTFVVGRRRPKRKSTGHGRLAAGIVALLFSGILILLLPIPAMLVLPQLTIEVRPGEVTAQLWPFQLSPERIDLAGAASHVERTYDPVGEFGGWGIRGRGPSRAYNARGTRGVQLQFYDGTQLLLGSQQPAALADAITQARGQP